MDKTRSDMEGIENDYTERITKVYDIFDDCCRDALKYQPLKPPVTDEQLKSFEPLVRELMIGQLRDLNLLPPDPQMLKNLYLCTDPFRTMIGWGGGSLFSWLVENIK